MGSLREDLNALLDQWHVLGKGDGIHGKQLREVIGRQPIDPADVEVGMVVEIEANDGTWSVKGEVVHALFNREFLNIRIGLGPRGISVTDATVWLVSRPEPDPSEQERAALCDVYDAAVAYITGDHGGPDSGGFRDVLIAELHFRGVRVVEDGEQ